MEEYLAEKYRAPEPCPPPFPNYMSADFSWVSEPWVRIFTVVLLLGYAFYWLHWKDKEIERP